MKKVLLALTTVFVIVVIMLAVTPSISADPPEQHSPVYPSKVPPARDGVPGDQQTNSLIQSVHVQPKQGPTIVIRWCTYRPYKSGSNAVSKAWTYAGCAVGYLITVYTDAWLWKWVGDHWVEVAHDGRTCTRPYEVSCTAMAIYSNAQSAYCQRRFKFPHFRRFKIPHLIRVGMPQPIHSRSPGCVAAAVGALMVPARSLS